MNQATLDAILPYGGKGRRGKLFLSKNCYSPENALKLYQYLKMSLLDINNWRRRKSGISINAILVDLYGRQVGRIACVNDRIKIILPRWKSFLRIYDWFEIRRIEERMEGHTEIFFVTIVPSVDPQDDLSVPPESSKQVSSATIFIIRDQNKVELQIHTRERRIDFRGSTLKARLENIVESLFMHNRFTKASGGNC